MKRTITILLMFAVVTALAAAGGDQETSGSDAVSEADIVVKSGFQSVTEAGVNVQWKVEGERLHVIMAAQTTGWVSVGFDPSRQMKDANIIIGYVADGEVMLRDDFGTGAVRHGADIENGGEDNLADVAGSETDGVTTISFSIPLNSGDALDQPLTVGGTHKMIVAYGPDGKDDFGSYHAGRGSVEISVE